MGEETGGLILMMNGEEININDISSIGIEHLKYSEEISKPVTRMKCRININAHDMEMALYELTQDTSIFYEKSYFMNRRLPEIYKF